LPELHGGPEVLLAGRAIGVNPAMQAALDWLEQVHELLIAYGVAGKITFDLGETRGMEYYTGITFKGYTPGLGFSVCSGGRYDESAGPLWAAAAGRGLRAVGRSPSAGPPAPGLAARVAAPGSEVAGRRLPLIVCA
jgi:ATP phosphoribosyltransferase regulatory subunit HisZ